MPEMPVHDWFRPRLVALLADAEQAGYARDIAEAVITDLVNGALVAQVALAPVEENWAQDIGEPKPIAQEMPGRPALPPETQGDGTDLHQMPDIQGQVTV